MKYLFLIPARGGSKGIPHKNIKSLAGEPLIYRAIDVARQFTGDDNICVSTDGDEIITTVVAHGLKVPFKRPDELATDRAGSYGVILHAIDFFEKQNKKYDAIVLLQPTSPFRRKEDVQACIEKYESGDFEMVVTVEEAKTNPYYNCFEADDKGYLHKTIQTESIVRRQEAGKCYEYNGAVYVMSVDALKQRSMGEFSKRGFVEMDKLHSLDLDDLIDWNFAEYLIAEKLI